MLGNSLSISKEYLKKVIKPGDTVIDATCGNGLDTLYLKELTGKEGKVFGFDIQDIALENTKKLLKEKGQEENVFLTLCSHSELDKYVCEPVKAVVFNLGYLPKGDHSITTLPETTIVAIEKALQILIPGGIISVMIYHGGDSGFHERDELIKYLERLDNKRFTVLMHNFINQINYPPILAVIEKKK
ncbi:MAG: methyltransferase domain-containing protein [Ruminococcaceae bacterium]|nr:methyltransferase domain-containing protein [Oscillospiraceae bacterium]